MSVSLNNVNSENDTHRAATNNPHDVTATQVGAYTKSEVNNLINTNTPFGFNPHIKPSDSQFSYNISNVYRFKEVSVGNSGVIRAHNNTYGFNNGIGGDWSKMDGDYTAGNYIWAIYKEYYDSTWTNLTSHRFFTNSNLSLADRLSDARTLEKMDCGYIQLTTDATWCVGRPVWFWPGTSCQSKLIFAADGVPRAYLLMGNATFWSNTIIALLKLS